jgi:hypothetical protein
MVDEIKQRWRDLKTSFTKAYMAFPLTIFL